MKKILTTLAIILAGTQVFATIRTCNNNNPSPGQYSSLAAAVTAASSGDTIYLNGSPVDYYFAFNTHYTKNLIIIGTGFNPQKQNVTKSRLNGFAISYASVLLSGIEISGTEDIDIGTSGLVSLDRCIVDSIAGTNGNAGKLVIKSSIVKGIINYSLSVQLEIYNSIIYSHVIVGILNGYCKLVNNVFLTNNSYFVDVVNSIYDNAIFKNNIFYGGTAVNGTPNAPGEYGIFTFNVSRTNPFVDDDGNNIVANPLFVNVPIGTTTYNPAHDYHLQATSPGILNLGDDLTQRGIYGSILPNTFSVTGMPGIPSIQTMSVTPSTVLSGQSIQVNFSSKTNQ